MSSLHCPYCEIKELRKIKEIFEALQPIDGRCPDCGAYIDAGQLSVKVNGYKEIYDGAVKLMQEMVDRFNDILDECDVDLEYHYDNECKICISPYEIVDALFIPHYGGTTKSNFMKALGIDSDYIDFEIKRGVIT